MKHPVVERHRQPMQSLGSANADFMTYQDLGMISHFLQTPQNVSRSSIWEQSRSLQSMGSFRSVGAASLRGFGSPIWQPSFDVDSLSPMPINGPVSESSLRLAASPGDSNLTLHTSHWHENHNSFRADPSKGSVDNGNVKTLMPNISEAILPGAQSKAGPKISSTTRPSKSKRIVNSKVSPKQNAVLKEMIQSVSVAEPFKTNFDGASKQADTCSERAFREGLILPPQDPTDLFDFQVMCCQRKRTTPGCENYLGCLCSEPEKCRGAGSRDPRLDTPKATLTHELMSKQRNFQTRLKMKHPTHQEQVPGSELLQWWCKSRRKALNGLQKWIMWESGFVLLKNLRLSQKKQRPTAADITEWKRRLVGFGQKSEFYWRQWAPCWCPALIEFLGRTDLETTEGEQWLKKFLLNVEISVAKSDEATPKDAAKISIADFKTRYSRHWKALLTDRGLAKIQTLIKKFFATEAPTKSKSQPLSTVVTNVSYRSAAKKLTKRGNAKNTPFTVLASHQNKFQYISHGTPHENLAGVVLKTKTCEGGADNNSKRKLKRTRTENKASLHPGQSKKRKTKKVPTADLMAASAAVGPDIARAIAASAAAASASSSSSVSRAPVDNILGSIY